MRVRRGNHVKANTHKPTQKPNTLESGQVVSSCYKNVNSKTFILEIAVDQAREKIEVMEKHGPCYRLVLDKEGKVVDRILISKEGEK